ncbi:MAG: glutamate--tRNA ligase family protein [Chloroflexota bacterium]
MRRPARSRRQIGVEPPRAARGWPRRARSPATTDPGAGPQQLEDAQRFEATLPAVVAGLPRGLRTRYAPAPTGFLHLGHVANAVAVWGVARASSGAVVLRIEDHDRQRCRPEFEATLLDDLDVAGFTADEPDADAFRTGPSPFRQSDSVEAYEAAAEQLASMGVVYGCDCSRATFSRWESAHGVAWTGPGCPGGCSGRDLGRAATGQTWRVALGEGEVPWEDLAIGPQSGQPATGGDLPIRDRHGNWTYALCVVVDDLRHGIDLVIRGEDLVDSTPSQIRLARLLGRHAPPLFLHHPLIREPNGSKMSKAAGSVSVRALLAKGEAPGDLVDRAATAIGAQSLAAVARSGGS